jgi:hypothetical protein
MSFFHLFRYFRPCVRTGYVKLIIDEIYQFAMVFTLWFATRSLVVANLRVKNHRVRRGIR